MIWFVLFGILGFFLFLGFEDYVREKGFGWYYVFWLFVLVVVIFVVMGLYFVFVVFGFVGVVIGVFVMFCVLFIFWYGF